MKSSRLWFGLVLIGGGCLGFEKVEAAPIHGNHAHQDALEASLAHAGRYQSWSGYLMGGPSVWSSVIHPRITPAVESAIWKAIRTDPGETSPWIQFMLYKQSLDPVRFAHYHPNLSPALNRLSASSTVAQVVTPGSSTTPNGGTATPLTLGQEIPEPATWLLAIGLAGWGAWWRRRKNC
ncbi:MAG: PEP-CTERM sorting domain-containing protein [Isosphaerales bacterium]